MSTTHSICSHPPKGRACGHCHLLASAHGSTRAAHDKAKVFKSTRSERVLEEEHSVEQNFLTQYFKEVSSLPLLKPRQEEEFAQHIENQEIAMWRHILNNAPLVEDILDLIQTESHQPFLGPFTGIKRSAIKVLRQSTPPSRKAFIHFCEQGAKHLRSLDPDRNLADKILNELEKRKHELVKVQTKRGKIKASQSKKIFEAYLRNIFTLHANSLQARNNFVQANLRLVVTLARRYNFGQMSFPDLIQEGNLGLIKAIGRFNHRRGYRFNTYAAWWIRHFITRALADKGRLVRVPVYVLTNKQRISKAKRTLSSQLGRLPTSEEVCACTGLKVEMVDQLLDQSPSRSFSLDAPMNDERQQSYIEILEENDPRPHLDSLIDQELFQYIKRELEHLKPIEAAVIRERFGLEDGEFRSLAEIGAIHHLSRERIRQIQDQALNKIRFALKRQDVL